MRLIDADALKKAFEETVCITPMPYAFVRQIIDNAPTVEAVPLEFHEKCMEKTVGELIECQSNLRPKGEWSTKYINGNSYFICSACQELQQNKGNYCPECGADMREAEKDG